MKKKRFSADQIIAFCLPAKLESNLASGRCTRQLSTWSCNGITLELARPHRDAYHKEGLPA